MVEIEEARRWSNEKQVRLDRLKSPARSATASASSRPLPPLALDLATYAAAIWRE